MRNVAFLSFDWDYEIVSGFYTGMRACLEDHGDVRLTIFNAFGQYTNYQPEEGAFEVFSLCQHEDYDGFLVQGNRAWPPRMREEVVRHVSELGRPVVSVNYDLKGAYHVGTDNYAAMHSLVSRVLRDRHCKHPAFINGFASSEEAQARSRAFHAACFEHGVTDVRFYQANWEMEEGVKCAQRILEDPDDLPDVIFCCNDDLAVGVQNTLQSHGVRVPQDVMVSGFDNREIGLKARPRITSVDRDYVAVGHTAMQTMIQLLDGVSLSRHVSSPARLVLAESCGYGGQSESHEEINDSLRDIDHAHRRFFDFLTLFQPKILSAGSLPEIFQECERNFSSLGCESVYLTINQPYLINEATAAARAYGPTSLLVAQDGPYATGRHDADHVYATFASATLLPPDVPRGQSVYVVYPLRHNSTCIGTLVTEGISPILRYGFLTILITLVSSAIESERKREMLEAANARLDDLYVHDQLTGLFNRFGLDRFGTLAYEHLLRDFGEAHFIFVDVDNMKHINDECGHEAGDWALEDTAEVLRRAMNDENAFAMRYGGDEFLLIARRDLTAKIEHELDIMHESGERPYRLSLSMGVYKVSARDGYSVKEAVDRADARMYEIKRAHKIGR